MRFAISRLIRNSVFQLHDVSRYLASFPRLRKVEEFFFFNQVIHARKKTLKRSVWRLVQSAQHPIFKSILSNFILKSLTLFHLNQILSSWQQRHFARNSNVESQT